MKWFLLVCLLIPGAVFASPGDFDTTFGSDGIVLSNLDRSSFAGVYVSDVLVQSDGKIIVAGSITLDQITSTLIVRLLPNGQLDESFGENGRIIETLYGEDEGARSIALQSDNKIVVVGYAYEPNFTKGYLTILRYHSSGQPDLTFNGTGKKSLDHNGFTISGKEVIVQPDQKIIAIGGNDGDIVVFRTLQDGGMDNSFGSAGKTTFRIGTNQRNYVEAVALQNDGKIVIAGSVSPLVNSSTRSVALSRLDPSGNLDLTFGNSGSATTTFNGNPWNYANALSIQNDGKILIGGATTLSNRLSSDFAIARYIPDGTLDPAFDVDGRLTTNFETSNGVNSEDWISDIEFKDEKIIVSGVAALSSFRKPSLIRYNLDGTPDNSFDTDGKLQILSPNQGGNRSDMAIATDGSIFLAHQNGTFGRLQAAKLSFDGSFDTSFDSNGIVWPRLVRSLEDASSLEIQDDGRIIVAGRMDIGSAICAVATRYTVNGSLDMSFGFGGVSNYCFDFEGQDGRRANPFPTNVLVQPDDRILLTGYIARFPAGTPTLNFFIIRLLPDGSVDDTFGQDGFIETNFSTDSNDKAFSSDIYPDGTIVLAGETHDGDGRKFAVARYLANGELDSTFDSDGKLTIDIPGVANQAALDLKVQSNGKLTIVGETDNTFLSVLRLNHDGSFDPSFNGNGRFSLYQHVGQSLTIQDDGKLIILTRPWFPSSGSDFGLVKLTVNGELDTSFGNGGVVVTNLGNAETGLAIALQSNGRIVVSGFTHAQLESRFATLRYEPNGDLDTTFGQGGIVISDLAPEKFDAAADVKIQSDGRLIIAGSIDTAGIPATRDFAIVRYLGDDTTLEGSQAPFDFDGDGKTDIGITRDGSSKEWWINRSSNGLTFATSFGLATDTAAPADYTGDGKADVTVFRPSTGFWYTLRSEDLTFYAFPFGANGDTPAPGDFDGDGKADATVFRSSNQTWYQLLSGGGSPAYQFGAAGDKPVVGDYDGDGKSDIAIFRPSDGSWWIQRSTAGLLATAFGAGTDKAVPGDYTGDGKTDVAVWRPSTGFWYFLRSEDLSYFSFPWGGNGDIPASGDYDGDGKWDASVFRPTDATWYINRSTGTPLITAFGANGDRPIANSFVP